MPVTSVTASHCYRTQPCGGEGEAVDRGPVRFRGLGARGLSPSTLMLALPALPV